jgi:hypothetical protein
MSWFVRGLEVLLPGYREANISREFLFTASDKRERPRRFGIRFRECRVGCKPESPTNG